MNNLRVIENKLVPVYETSTGEKVVYGSELYQALQSRRQYADWIKERLKECDAIKNVDYESFSQKNEKPQGGRPTMEYIIKLDTAKEMAMLERNEIGKQTRRYFIQVEKKYEEKISLESNRRQSAKVDRIEVMLLNAKTRAANTYLKLANVQGLPDSYKQILVSKATETLSGEQLIPLPKQEKKTLSAGDIGKIFGISGQMVGRIANRNGLKIPKYGALYHDKSRHSVKEVDTWRYYENVIPEFERILSKS